MAERDPVDQGPLRAGWRQKLHDVIFEAETSAGFAFDVVLLVSISLSVLVVMLASVAEINAEHGGLLFTAEWIFTILFSVEYVLRLLAVRRPLRYATSFYGVIDLISVIPTYIGTFYPGAESLLAIRVLRMVRVFRVFKLAPYLIEGRIIGIALQRSRQKIVVFLTTVLSAVVVMGATMFVVEGPASGFTSIPQGMYWAIVTITTVGYGDISPVTPLGKAFAAMAMILGYAIIAVPTGIVTVELAEASRLARAPTTIACPGCGRDGHDADATFCKYCGTGL